MGNTMHHRHDNAIPCHGTISDCVFCCVFLTAFSSAVVLNSSPAYNAVGSRPHPASVYTSSACDDCAARKLAEQANSEEYRYARIELIKQQILKKLRLKEPPNVRIPRSVLPSVLADKEVLLSQTTPAADDERNSRPREDYYGSMQTAVIFPHNDSHDCVSRSPHLGSCFVFHLSTELTSRSVEHAELWVFKDLDPSATSAVNHTFVVSELSVTDSHRSNRHHSHQPMLRKRVVAFESSSPRPEWLRFDLTSVVTQWAGRRNRPRVLEISCKTCGNLRNALPSGTPVGSSGDKQPFLVVRTDPNAPAGHSRSRRSVDCSSSISRCCRESFYVSFKEIGWDSWIIQPAGYSANFCRGSCIHDISVNKYHHTTVLQRFLHSAASAGVNDTLKLSLCCTPSRLSSISLIFIDDDQVIKQKSLPNMVVEACECA